MFEESKSIAVQKNPPSKFGAYGIKTLAYVKQVVIDGERFHSIHAADGIQLSVVEGREAAFALVRQHEMEPVSVH